MGGWVEFGWRTGVGTTSGHRCRFHILPSGLNLDQIWIISGSNLDQMVVVLVTVKVKVLVISSLDLWIKSGLFLNHFWIKLGNSATRQHGNTATRHTGRLWQVKAKAMDM
jgi:hypothetical protein